MSLKYFCICRNQYISTFPTGTFSRKVSDSDRHLIITPITRNLEPWQTKHEESCSLSTIQNGKCILATLAHPRLIKQTSSSLNISTANKQIIHDITSSYYLESRQTRIYLYTTTSTTKKKNKSKLSTNPRTS